MRGSWKFSSIRSGGEFCWTPGVSLNPLWSADSWAVALCSTSTGSSSSSPEHSHECVTGFQCSGSEAHLGNCSSPQTLNCSSTQQLSVTCLGEKNNICADSAVVCGQ